MPSDRIILICCWQTSGGAAPHDCEHRMIMNGHGRARTLKDLHRPVIWRMSGFHADLLRSVPAMTIYGQAHDAHHHDRGRYVNWCV